MGIFSAIGSIVGGLLGQSSQDDQMNKQIAAQREFAQHGIRWRVEDATKAGVHPLFALGANTHSFSPIGIGGSPLAEGIAGAGQGIDRAISAKGTGVERAFNARMMELQLQRGELENALLASQIARSNAPTQVQPAMPMPGRYLIEGQGQTSVDPLPERFGGPLVQNVPLERIVSDPANLHAEPGAITDVGWARTATGGYAPVPSGDVKERIEDQLIPEIGWALRNVLLPNIIGGKGGQPPFPAPAGKRWVFSRQEQAYHLVDYSGDVPWYDLE